MDRSLCCPELGNGHMIELGSNARPTVASDKGLHKSDMVHGIERAATGQGLSSPYAVKV